MRKLYDWIVEREAAGKGLPAIGDWRIERPPIEDVLAELERMIPTHGQFDLVNLDQRYLPPGSIPIGSRPPLHQALAEGNLARAWILYAVLVYKREVLP
jgi:hypothetical protein